MEKWILVVDADDENLRMANDILCKEKLRVSCLKSGEEAIRFMRENRPDLILLDLHMPEMAGFDTVSAIRENEDAADIPVIFMTADDASTMEITGLEAKTIDFIKKPLVPAILLLRVRHMIELASMQKMVMQTVRALSGAIDEAYTNGHSNRVAEYSKEIARRAGLSEEIQNDIYVMGLLHDVGKIGIPNTIINKPTRLTDEEYAIIKSHPAVGGKILQNITEFPRFAVGARWHHERYDGKGYPDGIAGEAIPMEARILAVADAYDAMTSKRSYRGSLLQKLVRAEVEKGKGTQLDPAFADIMISMIDDDVDYQMREM